MENTRRGGGVQGALEPLASEREIVFDENVLCAIAHRRPPTIDEMSRILGLGLVRESRHVEEIWSARNRGCPKHSLCARCEPSGRTSDARAWRRPGGVSRVSSVLTGMSRFAFAPPSRVAPFRPRAGPRHAARPVRVVRARASRDVRGPPVGTEDAELASLAAALDAANAAASEAQAAYARAVEARVSPPSASEDEADRLFNASPFANVRCEYGYIQSNAGLYIDVSKSRPPGVPKNIVSISTQNFRREFDALRAALRGDDSALGNGGEKILVVPGGEPTDAEVELMSELRDMLGQLSLSNDAIWERERARPEVPAPWIIKAPYFALCYFLDLVFPENAPVQRFWFLESVARMPYFSYNTMLTVYELLGWWRRSSELRRVHFAEEWNEYHHLLIMESLGGDRRWRDRFLAQHAALVYYVVLLALWLVSPALAYNFSELIEAHAVDTYGQFADQNKELLRKLPAPRIAKAYYESEDLYLFDEFQTARPRSSRRPTVKTLHDVFEAIRDDEGEHVATMRECQMEDSMMEDVAKVNLGTAAVLALVAANVWINRAAESVGLDSMESTGVDLGTMLGEDGAVGILTRLLSMLPFF